MPASQLSPPARRNDWRASLGWCLVPEDGAVVIAQLGAGVVGSGVARILHEKRHTYARQLGRPLLLKGALVRNPTKNRPGVDSSILTTEASGLLDDPNVDIVVEVIGGEQPSLDFITR